MKFFVLLIFSVHWNLLIIPAHPRPPMVLHDLESNKTTEIMRYAKGAGIKNFMNESIDPCDDFYKFACGNWARINPAIRTSKNGIFNVLSESYDRKVAKWLNRPKVSSESDMERKVKYFYESCINLDGDYDYRQKLLAIMEEFGGMPALKGDKWKSDEFDWLTVVAEILRKYGKQIIIGVDISADLSNNEVNRLYIGQPEHKITTRAPEYYSFLSMEYHMELRSVLGMNSSLAGKIAMEIVKFEESLAKGISDPLDGVVFQDKCKKRSLDDMSRLYKPTLNFTRFISTWLGYNYQLPVYEYVESYQQNLKNIIEKTPESTVANYIMWHLIQDFRMEPKAIREKQKAKCIEVTKRVFVPFLDNVVYHELLAKDKNLLYDVQEIWRDLKGIFEEVLLGKESLWMTPETRDKALEKLSAMSLEINSYETEDFDKENAEIVIGTDTFFDNIISLLEHRGRKYREKVLATPKLDSGDMFFTPAYAPNFNRILLPIAFLQPHFLWHPVYPVALKYATVGYIIAHEMAHGFDDNGREFDAKGNINSWWDEMSTQQFLVRKECMSQHYSEYIFADDKMIRSNAQDENIADNVGIRVAFVAYEKWFSKQTNKTLAQQERLPYLNLTPLQLFFVGVAQVWCTDVHTQVRPYLTKVDVHVPEEIRVSGMVSNFESFAEQFQCKADARMHPQRKCVMY